MPLKQCPSCGKMISDRAEKCIFCGNTTQTENVQEDQALKDFLEKIEEEKVFTIRDGQLISYNKEAKILRIPESVRYFSSGDYAHDWAGYFIPGVPGFFEENLSIEEVSIPGTIRAIGIRSFSMCSNLRNLVIQDGLEVIEKSAFSNCEKLERIRFPATLKKIEENAFCNCTSLNEVVIPSAVEIIGKKAFYNCKNLRKITINGPINKFLVGDMAFSKCDTLEEITISDGPIDGLVGTSLFAMRPTLKRINLPEECIEDGYRIEELKGCQILIKRKILNHTLVSYIDMHSQYIEIPAGVHRIVSGALKFDQAATIVLGDEVEEIESGVFDNLTNLKEIIVQTGNPKYCSVNGVLYTNDMQTLIFYPPQKKEETFIVPVSVTTIEHKAFLGVQYLNNLFIPDSVTKIAENAIYESWRRKIKNIRYPSSYESF